MTERKLPPIPSKIKGPLSAVPVVLTRLDDGITGRFRGNDDGMPEILIEERLGLPYRWQTFFHELLHLLEMDGEFELKDKPNDSDANRLATGLLAMWLRNNWKLPGE